MTDMAMAKTLLLFQKFAPHRLTSLYSPVPLGCLDVEGDNITIIHLRTSDMESKKEEMELVLK